MKHLLVSYHTCPLEEPGAGLAGGMNVFLRGLLPGLARFGIRTDVLTRATGTSPETTVPCPGVRIVHVPCGWRTPASREGALDALPRFVAGARRLAASPGPAYDVVSAHYWMSGVAAVRLVPAPRAPLVFSYHTVEALKIREAAGTRPDRLFLARTAAEDLLAREADRVVCFTRRDLAATRKVFPRLAGKGAVIPPGVDDAFRHPPGRTGARRLLGIPPRAFLFLLVARADPEKNVSQAIAAIREIGPDASRRAILLVAGQEGPPGAVPEGVVFAGPVPHDRMPRLYAAADAVLCPSLYESFGLVQLEAMAAGVPVIVPAGGYWGKRIGREGGGLVYDPADAHGIGEAMRAIRRDEALRARLSAESERAASAFTWERCTESWARLLSTLSRRGSRRGTPRAPGGPRHR